mmetsp:Transcript_16665/g.38313  ORF Transcript_16665/g.38313 Transcript_16665/m.38313 type:complete len:257 (+) Transcript_16665:124-894(+)
MFKFQVDTEFGPTTLFSPTATDSLVGGWRVRSSCKQATVFKPGDWIPVPRSYPISHRLRPMLRLALSPRTNRERGTRNPCSPGAGNLRRDPSERRQTPSLPISSPEASTKTRATPWPWERIARATRLPGGNNRLPVANRSRCRPFPKNKRREPRPFWRPGPPAPAVTTTTTTAPTTRLLPPTKTTTLPRTTMAFPMITGTASKNTIPPTVAKPRDVPGATTREDTAFAWTKRPPRRSTTATGTRARCRASTRKHRR